MEEDEIFEDQDVSFDDPGEGYDPTLERRRLALEQRAIAASQAIQQAQRGLPRNANRGIYALIFAGQQQHIQEMKEGLAALKQQRLAIIEQERELKQAQSQALAVDKLRKQYEQADADVRDKEGVLRDLHEKRESIEGGARKSELRDQQHVEKAQRDYQKAVHARDRVERDLHKSWQEWKSHLNPDYTPKSTPGYFGTGIGASDESKEAKEAEERFTQRYHGYDPDHPNRKPRSEYPELEEDVDSARTMMNEQQRIAEAQQAQELQSQHHAELEAQRQLERSRAARAAAIREMQIRGVNPMGMPMMPGAGMMGGGSVPPPPKPPPPPMLPQSQQAMGQARGGGQGKMGMPSLNITPQSTTASLPTNLLTSLMQIPGGIMSGIGSMLGGGGKAGGGAPMGGGAIPQRNLAQSGRGMNPGQVSQFSPNANIPMPPMDPRGRAGPGAIGGQGTGAPPIPGGPGGQATPQQAMLSRQFQNPQIPYTMPPGAGGMGAPMPPQGAGVGLPGQPGAYHPISGRTPANMSNFPSTGPGLGGGRASGTDVMRQIINMGAQRGMNITPQAAAAMAGNLSFESGGNRFGGVNLRGVGDSGTAIGMGQWRGSRQAGVGNTLQSQVGHMLNEMQGGDRGAARAWHELQGGAGRDVASGTRAFMHDFERPASMSSLGDRTRLAQQFLHQYGGGGGDTMMARGGGGEGAMGTPVRDVIGGGQHISGGGGLESGGQPISKEGGWHDETGKQLNIGDVVGQHRFTGGNPNSRSNWEPMGKGGKDSKGGEGGSRAQRQRSKMPPRPIPRPSPFTLDVVDPYSGLA